MKLVFSKKAQSRLACNGNPVAQLGELKTVALGVLLGYASPQGYTSIDRELSLPKSWTSDPERCHCAKVPDEMKFAAKPQLARQMLERAFNAVVPAAWVTADEVYGSDRRLRLWLEEQQVYVMAVSTTAPI